MATDSISIKYTLFSDDHHDSRFYTERKHIEHVTVVSNGFTCEMTADEFFKIIHEAFQW